MSAGPMTLTISTPLEIVVRADQVRSFRADDESGGFGIMPGHVPLLSVLRACVVRWRTLEDGWSYCAVRGGVLTVEAGRDIRIACRAAILGADLAALETSVESQLAAEAEAARAARLQQARLHAQAIRKIILHLSDQGAADPEAALDGVFQ